MHSFSEKKQKYNFRLKPLIGLDRQSTLLKTFCEFAWSPKWKEQSSILQFMPTILLYGPPGTGKTSLLTSLAGNIGHECFKYYRENLDLLVNKDLGETSKAIKNLFDEIKEQAKCGNRVILQIDDIDSLLSSRYLANESSGVRRGVNTFLTQVDEFLLDSYQFTPIIAATTNMFDYLDSAVKRRFSLKLEVNPILEEDDVKKLIQPIINIIGLEKDFDYSEIAKISTIKMLTPGDLILAMQDIFLKNLIGDKISADLLRERIQESESSGHSFARQRKLFSHLHKEV